MYSDIYEISKIVVILYLLIPTVIICLHVTFAICGAILDLLILFVAEFHAIESSKDYIDYDKNKYTTGDALGVVYKKVFTSMFCKLRWWSVIVGLLFIYCTIYYLIHLFI